MLILYESNGYLKSKILYDMKRNRCLGHYEKFKLGWIWFDDFNKLESEHDVGQWEMILSELQRNKIGADYKTTEYETWEDFILDQL